MRMILTMRGRTRRMGVAVAVTALVALGAGCSNTPKAFGPCHHVIIYPNPGSSGYLAAYDWDDDVHAFGETVSITACFDTTWDAIPEGPPGVTFEPAQQTIPEVQYHVITFTITVPEGSTGPTFVRLEYSDGRSFSQPPGPVITPSGDGWKFTSPPNH